MSASRNRNLPIVREVAKEFGLTIEKVCENRKHVQVYVRDADLRQHRLTIRHSKSRPDYLRDWLRQNVRRLLK